MKCAQHNNVDAVATCQGCGKGLCPTCSKTFDKPLCKPCAVHENRSAIEHNQRLISAAKRSLLLPGVLLPVALVGLAWTGTIHGVSSFAGTLLFSLVVATTPAGWTFLGRYFRPSGGYIHIYARWVNAFFHLTLSMALGIFVGPYQMWTALRDIGTLKRINSEIRSSGYI
jgi:hypothetical protein